MSKSARKQSKAERVAAALREQQRAERRRQLLIIVSVVAVLAVVAGVGLLIQSQRDTAGEEDEAPADASSSRYGLTIGPDDAPAKVVIFEDFLCPICGYFEAETKDELARKAKAGEVQVEYRPFELLSQYGDYSQRAANAFAVVLDSAGSDAAKKFHDALFADQPTEGGPYHDDDWLVQQAVQAGAKENAVRKPIEDLEFEQWVVNATDEASKAGVNGTPTVFLNDSQVEGDNVDEVIENTLQGIEDAQ
jgi:protein-disulfide isomerase